MKHSIEFKLAAIKMAQEEGNTPRSAAEKLHVGHNVVFANKMQTKETYGNDFFS